MTSDLKAAAAVAVAAVTTIISDHSRYYGVPDLTDLSDRTYLKLLNKLSYLKAKVTCTKLIVGLSRCIMKIDAKIKIRSVAQTARLTQSKSQTIGTQK